MLKKVLLTLQIMFVLFVAATVLLYFKAVDVIQTPHKVDEPKIIQISNGESLTSIARNLKKNNLIENEFYFILYSKINKVYPKVKAGEYLIEKDISLRQLADLLTSGKVYLRKILYAENLLEGDFKVLKEGEFLPETYTFSRGTQRQKIVAQGIDAMQKILDQAWQERDADLPLKNKEELLILASIVEKETGVATERPQVASVFVNRLKRGMLLQTDPTVIYALTQGRQDLGRALTRRDLTVDSPYNTYKYAGLPPTPICSPGAASIKATAHPDKTPYLYFVASGNGGHNFARTLQEHNINVREYKKHR